MTTEFKQKVSEYNMYQLDNLPIEVLNSKYFRDNLEWYTERFNKVIIPQELISIKDIQVGVFTEIKTQYKNNSDEIELYYADDYCVLVFINNQVLRLKRHKGRYSLHPMFKDLNIITKTTNYNQRASFLDKLKTPNQMGVFTLKKLNDWADYCKQYLQALKECNDHINGKKVENQKVINDTIKSLPNAKGHTYINETSIYAKMFDIHFELLENGAYLKSNIIYKGG